MFVMRVVDAGVGRQVAELTSKRKKAQKNSRPVPGKKVSLNESEEILFATYEQKYQQTLTNMCQKNNRRFGYGLEIEGAASRATLIDRL